MPIDSFELTALALGDTFPFILETRYDAGVYKGQAANPSSAVAWVYDPERVTEGIIESGNALTLVDDALDQADDFWNGVPLTIQKKATGTTYKTEVTDFDQGDTKLTFREIPVAVAAGDRYRLEGYPLLVAATVSVSANLSTITVSPSNATRYPGRRNLILRVTFSGGMVKTFRGWFYVHDLADG